MRQSTIHKEREPTMSEIKIQRSHQLGQTEAQKRVTSMEAKLKDKYGVKLDWKGNHADVKGSGVSGTISVLDQEVAVQLKLGLLLKPMSGKIREALETQIDKALG